MHGESVVGASSLLFLPVCKDTKMPNASVGQTGLGMPLWMVAQLEPPTQVYQVCPRPLCLLSSLSPLFTQQQPVIQITCLH